MQTMKIPYIHIRHNFMTIISIILVFCILIINVDQGKVSIYYQVAKNAQASIQHITLQDQMRNSKTSDSVDYSFMEEQIIFDEELFRKYLISYFYTNRLILAFSSLILVFLHLLLRSIRRGKFEETHFIHTLILMDYIHRIDGEWQTEPC
jgi:Na+/H+ antiporter NhaC